MKIWWRKCQICHGRSAIKRIGMRIERPSRRKIQRRGLRIFILLRSFFLQGQSFSSFDFWLRQSPKKFHFIAHLQYKNFSFHLTTLHFIEKLIRGTYGSDHVQMFWKHKCLETWVNWKPGLWLVDLVSQVSTNQRPVFYFPVFPKHLNRLLCMVLSRYIGW